MFERLIDLHTRIDRQNLRVRRPHHTVFLCGGLISNDRSNKDVLSVRDYLVRFRNIESKIGAQIVLAETAQQLYRETSYPDLISFEEDVARIASVVMVISESPGALAELGAFASEKVIRNALRLIINEEHFEHESFIRYGPVKRIESIDRERIGAFPWRLHKKNNCLVKRSISPHYREIVNFIHNHVQRSPESHSYRTLDDARIFFDILWILSLLEAVPPEPLYDAVRIIHPQVHDDFIRNRLFILKTCGWIHSFSYSGRDFYFLKVNNDPYEYSFIQGRRARDVPSQKLEIAQEFHNEANISRPIMNRLLAKRKGEA